MALVHQSTMATTSNATGVHNLTRAAVCRFLVQPLEWQTPDWYLATWAVTGAEAHKAARDSSCPVMIWHCADRKEPAPWLARVGDRWKMPRRLTYRGASYWKLG